MSRLQKLFALLLFVVIAGPSKASDIDLEKSRLVSAMESDGAQTSDLDLIKAHLGDLSLEQLTAISQFLTNPLEFADSHWFDVSQYKSWDEYNFYRPVGDTILSILARRDLFLDPARQLNNPAITNMSDEALAALAFSQVYVEEKWDHEVPWDGDPNAIFNWIHPDIIKTPNLILFLRNDNFLYTARTEYWWGTYWSALMPLIAPFGISKGTDMQAALRDMNPPVSNIPRLAGYSYPLGNQLFLQTAETVYWYADYVTYGEARYGPFEPKPLDTAILFPESSAEIYQKSILDRCKPGHFFIGSRAGK